MATTGTNEFESVDIDRIIAVALDEDLRAVGDLSTQATVPAGAMATGRFLAKADGVLAGLAVTERVFAQVDAGLKVTWTKSDGDVVSRGEYFGTVFGSAHSILVAERLALNIMQRMSGVATATRHMVNAVGNHRARILDTRKTAPGLRALDKQAVRIGGGMNHRYGLYDMVMIKDNHVSAAGGVTKAVEAVKAHLKSKGLWGKVPVELETRTLDEVNEALRCDGVDRLMLDNMVKVTATGVVDTSMLRQAVELIRGRIPTEASGNVTLQTVGAIAATGVDFISSGSLSHSVTALDISLKIGDVKLASRL